MRYSTAYEKALEIRKEMADSLLQKVNFFLIGTAFLIAGLGALVASGNSPGLTGDSMHLAYIISALGLYIALFFAVINSLNMAILADFSEYVKGLEEQMAAGRADLPITDAPPYTRAEEITESRMWPFPRTFLAHPFCQLYLLLIDPRKATKEGKAYHALLLPALFVLGWILIICLALPYHRLAIGLVFGLIGLVPAVYALIKLIRHLQPGVKGTATQE